MAEQRTHKPLVAGSNPAAATIMDNISFEEFKKLDIRVGKILSVEVVQGSEKLLNLEVDIGNEKRQIIAGIAKVFKPEELVGNNFVVLANLEPKKLMGRLSQGMILCADDEGKPVCLTPVKDVPAGSKIL